MPKNIKKSVKTTILSAMAMMLCIIMSTESMAQNAMSREHLSAKKILSGSRLTKQLGFLCDSICHGRAFATPGGAEAAFWITREFERIGLMKIGGSFARKVPDGKGRAGNNIIGMLPGSKYFSRDRYIIVGAHYDHIGELSGKMYPGADANASGTVAMINLAEMIMGIRNYGKSHNYNIIFVAFDGKEQSMAGSYAFWKLIEEGALTDPQTGKVITREKITLMVNIDQIGSTMSPLSS